MSQNNAAATALVLGGGIGFPSLDAQGNLRVVTPPVTPPAVITALNASSGSVAASAAVATLAASALKLNSLSGIHVSGGGATGATTVLATITGLVGGTMTVVIPVAAGANVAITPVNIQFNPPIPASAINTPIVLTVPSFGVGNLNAAANAWGTQQ